MILLLLGCTGALPEDTADSLCTDAPTLSWADYGQPLLLEHCDTCHAAAATDRYGAPESVTFDTLADVKQNRSAMLRRLTSDPPTMPPALPVPETDLTLLVTWLTCDVPTE